MNSDPLVAAVELSRHFSVGAGWFRRRRIDAVKSASFEIYANEIVALVGESGSGKTTLGRMMLGLVKPSSGVIEFHGRQVTGKRRREMRELRCSASIIFQNPFQSLNPRMRIGNAIAEALRVSGTVPRSEIRGEVDRLLAAVHLPASYYPKYPIALSGGEQQRVAIARALAGQPDFLVADEPTSALDVSVAAQVLNALIDVRRDRNFACLFITHDLALAMSIADRLLIMRDGVIVESGTPEDLAQRPADPYTKELLTTLRALPGNEPSAEDGGLAEAGRPFGRDVSHNVSVVTQRKEPS